MPIFSFESRYPTIAATAYVSPTATVIGRVIIGERAYIGHGAILRGDYGNVEIGDETAVEEGVLIHARPEDWTRVGRRVTLGHGAMVHNAVIADGAVVGMRAVISDFAEVGEGAIVGEMGLVKNGQKVPAGKVAVGVPARVVGDVDDRHRAMTHWAKELYVDLAGRYARGAMVEVDPTTLSPRALPRLQSIGVVRTPYARLGEIPREEDGTAEAEGVVHLDDAYAGGLRDVERSERIILLWAPHEASGYSLDVKPPGETRARGLFATRTPRRPNPICMTVVKVLAVEGRSVRVRGVDMLDDTPLLDIKPYLPKVDGGGDS